MVSLMSTPITLRFATGGDAAILAEHRVAMFREMGTIHATLEQRLRAACEVYVLPIESGVSWSVRQAAGFGSPGG